MTSDWKNNNREATETSNKKTFNMSKNNTVKTRIKETRFLHLGTEFLNEINHFYHGKRYKLHRKIHFFFIFEVSGFILAKLFWLKCDIHGISLFSS